VREVILHGCLIAVAQQGKTQLRAPYVELDRALFPIVGGMLAGAFPHDFGYHLQRFGKDSLGRFASLFEQFRNGISVHPLEFRKLMPDGLFVVDVHDPA
jgi:hypothetical protein